MMCVTRGFFHVPLERDFGKRGCLEDKSATFKPTWAQSDKTQCDTLKQRTSDTAHIFNKSTN